ncbi:flagellar biosynthesis protein FlhA [uncultured Tyzzerella sp.]|uniref:flagellar biosynthesis protein FlhA n=1 Tax=uncultured Tyzzerella sp. TaxID=2321398 RepID=UPI002942DD7C|nr:flagellar biosynthesis protein FlhA [uncultured Tyzzerella sp.]
MKIKEAFLGIFIILIVLVLIIPIPSFLLDFLFMINIFFAVLILLDAIYSKKALDMSMFPTILLVTTLFRISLNLSSTKLILLEGDAGEVIETFGNFVAGGNMVVGVIIFLILVLVNFMVITKGSERVSEVTARFTLDAMPGKQMAIDADLNTGLINDDEAKARRKEIQDEASFYGAMDGAAKFVKGDAIAGIIITIINVAGGITLGMTGLSTGVKLPFGEAVQIYTLMTIGDGLVGQIPAILISTATGILVTKSSEEDGITSSITKQLFSIPLTLYIAGAVMIVLGFTPLPTMFFVPFGIALIFCGYQLDKAQKVQSITEEISTEDEEVEEIRRPENVISLLNVDPILLIFGYGLIPLVDSSQGGDLLDRVVMIRRQIALELGAVVPIIRLRDDIKLAPNQYKILIKGVEVAEGEILFDHYMAMNPGYIDEEIDGIETIEPYLGLPALWITETQRERAEALGYTVVDPPAIIATHLTEIIRNSLNELLSRQDVQTLIDNVKEQHPVLVDELMPKLLGIGEVQKVLANLLKEGISIRDLVTILETLADYAQVTRDTDMLTEYVRQSLKRNISQRYFADGENKVITLDPQLEQEIMESIQHSEQGSFIALEPEKTQMIFNSLNTQLSKLTSLGIQPIILTSPVVRIYFKKLVEQIAPDLIVISYNEIDPRTEIQSIGMVGI